nr:hypothetical protein CFP56_70355 [Quercus suber]
MHHSVPLLHSFSCSSHGLQVLHKAAQRPSLFLIPILDNSRQSSPPMASLHLSVKDVTEIVTLLILILKLIAELRECIRYFRRGGWQQDGGNGTTNNKMGTESYNSIVASDEASTSARNGAYSTLSYYFLEFHAVSFFPSMAK